jgi:hypothetical protein
MRALVTGAAGLIGKQIFRSIENPVVLSPDRARLGGYSASWKPTSGNRRRVCLPKPCPG